MKNSPDWVCLNISVILAIHDSQLAEHGGGAGIRDHALLESALTRPQHLAIYEKPDAATLAAAYGYGIARNHPFTDGNKRTAFVAVELFLALNGYRLGANDADCVLTTLALATGDIEEEEFSGWIHRNSVSR